MGRVDGAGAASLDLAWTASGSFDGYFEAALGPWDMAAGALLVREAGGRVTDWRGDPDAWLRSGDIVAAPPAIAASPSTFPRITTGFSAESPRESSAEAMCRLASSSCA